MDNKELVEKMKTWRHYLHAHPETAFEENNTADYIANILSDLGLEVHRNIGKTGIVANLKVGDSDKAIGLRADMDAINLAETSDLEYKSKTPGKMHACGHDGHITNLLGVATLLANSRDFNGTVRFIFQPAEEPGKGAQAMIDDGLFERFPMDEIYGLHSSPSYAENTVNVCKGGILASEDNFTIKIKGKGSHASSPHIGIDPLVIGAQIIMSLQTIVSRNMNPLRPAVVSCTEILTDGAHNAIPSNVTILGDTRSSLPETQELIETRMEKIVRGLCEANNVDYEFSYTHEFGPTINWDECVDTLVVAANEVVGTENVNANCDQWMGAEDFGCYLEKIPGCYFFLGTQAKDSELIPLHNSKYDYNDNTLETAVKIFEKIVMLKLPNK